VLLGDSDGTFQAPVSFAVSRLPDSVADLDGDSVPDLATTDTINPWVSDYGTVTVLLNLSDPPAPQEVPALGPVGSAILLSLLGATAYSRLRHSASPS